MIGACGWQHPRWLEEFYPEDLPAEWQLGYYGNEYRVVLIPAEYWQDVDLSVETWLEETDNSPLFLSEWPQDRVAGERARAGMHELGARGLGFVISLTQMPAEAEIGIYKELAGGHALVFDIGELSAQAQESALGLLTQALGENRFGICWHGEPQGQAHLALGPLALTRISAVKDHKELRRIIQTILEQSNHHRKMVLIVDGDPPDIQLLQNAGIMLDLL